MRIGQEKDTETLTHSRMVWASAFLR
jgi:hypothetical protein